MKLKRYAKSRKPTCTYHWKLLRTSSSRPTFNTVIHFEKDACREMIEIRLVNPRKSRKGNQYLKANLKCHCCLFSSSMNEVFVFSLDGIGWYWVVVWNCFEWFRIVLIALFRELLTLFCSLITNLLIDCTCLMFTIHGLRHMAPAQVRGRASGPTWPHAPWAMSHEP